jgi:aryl-alcohol dehydrogenase-like predicted oxidoreductase
MLAQQLLGKRTGLRVSAVALGTARLVDAAPTLKAFVDAGGTFFDSSSAYQGGNAEAQLGRFLAEAGRDPFVIASKYCRTTKADAPVAAMVGSHRGAMRMEIEGSLRRLGTDRIDVYFPHFDDGVTPMEEIARGLEDLQRAGKIIHVGLSNFPAWRVAELPGCAVLQMQYNLRERSIEREHLPLARTRGIAVMGWSPLSGGALGKPATTLPAVNALATELSTTPDVIAVSWVAAKGAIPVLGARSPAQLTLPIALTPAQVHTLDEAAAFAPGYPYDILADQQTKLGLLPPH